MTPKAGQARNPTFTNMRAPCAQVRQKDSKLLSDRSPDSWYDLHDILVAEWHIQVQSGDFGQKALSESREKGTMGTWDIVLLVVAGYVATFGLARLMTQRRQHLIERFREQMEQSEPNSTPDKSSSSAPQRRQAA